jgi:hypothetical protein
MENYTAPLILENAVFDTKTRTLYSLKEFDFVEYFPLSRGATTMKGIVYPDAKDTMFIQETTYMNHYLHYCFMHAYLDTTIPLLSILHDVDPIALDAREIRLFLLKDNLWVGVEDTKEIEFNLRNVFLNEYAGKLLDMRTGHYKGVYSQFQKVLSKYPVLLEETSPARFLSFRKLVIGGNHQYQRCVHNLAANYAGRFVGPAHATDRQIKTWTEFAKEHYRKYLGLGGEKGGAPKIAIIAREHNRSFLPMTLDRLSRLAAASRFSYAGVFYLETMDFVEQIRLFMSVDILITPHGSGLAHLIWCKPGTRVLEIFAAKDKRRAIFKRTCELFNLRYSAYFISEEEKTSDAFFEGDEAFFDAMEKFIYL